MLGDTFEVLVLLGSAAGMAFIGHSRSTHYVRTSLLVGVLSTVVWFAVVVARHHSPGFLLNSILAARVTGFLMLAMAMAAAGCAGIIAYCVSLCFSVGGKRGIALGLALLAFLSIVFLKACVYSNSGGPVDPL